MHNPGDVIRCRALFILFYRSVIALAIAVYDKKAKAFLCLYLVDP